MPEIREYIVTQTRTTRVSTAHGVSTALALAERALDGAQPDAGGSVRLPEQWDKGRAERPTVESIHIDPAR